MGPTRRPTSDRSLAVGRSSVNPFRSGGNPSVGSWSREAHHGTHSSVIVGLEDNYDDTLTTGSDDEKGEYVSATVGGDTALGKNTLQR